MIPDFPLIFLFLDVYMHCKGIWIPNRLHTVATELIFASYTSIQRILVKNNAAKKEGWGKGGEV